VLSISCRHPIRKDLRLSALAREYYRLARQAVAIDELAVLDHEMDTTVIAHVRQRIRIENDEVRSFTRLERAELRVLLSAAAVGDAGSIRNIIDIDSDRRRYIGANADATQSDLLTSHSANARE
jgi:hypothetical protein